MTTLPALKDSTLELDGRIAVLTFNRDDVRNALTSTELTYEIPTVIESMKMEIPVITEDPGTVKEILAKEKDPVAEGQVVAILEG